MKRGLSIFLITVLLLGCFAAAGVSANAATKLSPGYYVVGTFNNWSLDKAYRMQSAVYDRDNDKAAYYILKAVKLNEGDELKVAYSADGILKSAWYPDSGPQTNYVIQDDSYYTIALALPTDGTLGCWDWQLWVEPCDPPTDDPVKPTEPVDRTKELWEKNADLTAEDIEEAVNDAFNSRRWIGSDEIAVHHSYRFECTPAYEVDFEVEGYFCYACVILEELFGDYFFTSSSSYEPYIFMDNKLYTISQAYEAGILTEAMLAELAEADHGTDHITTSNWFVTRYVKGDADADGEVNIIDATVIQRKEANISTGAFYKTLADVDGDSAVSIIDATLIQRKEAGLYVIQ